MSYDRVLAKFAWELKERYGSRIEKVILYGSAARGELGEESDIDVLVVVDKKDRRIVKEIEALAVKTMKRINRLVSPLILDKEAYAEMVRERYPFILRVRREGVVYA